MVSKPPGKQAGSISFGAGSDSTAHDLSTGFEQCVQSAERLGREGEHFSLYISLLTAHCEDSTEAARAKILWKMKFPGLLLLAILITPDNWALEPTQKLLMLMRKRHMLSSALVTKGEKKILYPSKTEADAEYF